MLLGVVQVLPLPPCPQLSEATGTIFNTQTALLPGRSVSGNAPLRMGLLPGKDNAQPRTATFILNADHPFWGISTPSELYKYLKESFPQVEAHRWPDLVPQSAAERFVSTKAGSFPHPQTCPKLVALFEEAAPPEEPHATLAGLRGCGAVLLGDAAHVFPPGVATDDVFFLFFAEWPWDWLAACGNIMLRRGIMCRHAHCNHTTVPNGCSAACSAHRRATRA